MKAMKPQTITRDRVEELLRDDAWVMQQKYDGVRCTVFSRQGHVYSTNARGEIAGEGDQCHLGEIHGEFPRNEEYVLDGELAWGNFYPFDELSNPAAAYHERLTRACDIVDRAAQSHIRRVKTWLGTAAKTAAWGRIEEQAVEGVIFRRIDGAWSEGVDKKRDLIVRYKFVKRAEVIVDAEAKPGCRSIHVGLYDPQLQIVVRCGKISHGLTDTTRRQIAKALDDDLDLPIEIEYRYVSPNGMVVEAKFIRIRTDKDPADCTVDQLDRRRHLGEVDHASITADEELDMVGCKLPHRIPREQPADTGSSPATENADVGRYIFWGVLAVINLVCWAINTLYSSKGAPRGGGFGRRGGGGGQRRGAGDMSDFE